MTMTDRSKELTSRGWGSRLVAAVTAGALAAASFPIHAQAAGGPSIIRDAEIEQLLRDYSQPILRVAGLSKQNIRVVIINNRGFNAFVMDGRRIFINAGAIMEANSPNEVIGVLAHETGHIAGGHLARLRQQLANAQTQSIIAMVLGIGAMVAASQARGGLGQVGAAAVVAPQQMIMRSLLSYVRAQEDQADRAAVKFLNATGQSSKGMYTTFKRLADQTLYAAQTVDPYLQSHPMPSERVAALANLAHASPYWNKTDPPTLQQRHDLARAKLYGFLDRPETVYRRYPLSNTSLPARYARAIASYRFSDMRNSQAQIDALIRAQPNNPFFYELKGQALLEAGRAAEAIPPLRRAAQLNASPLIKVMLAQAMIATNNKQQAKEAVPMLEDALRREPEMPDALVHLAMAYGRAGDIAHADLASARAAFLRGDLKAARTIAARAKARFPVGSPGWLKADDITSYKPPPKPITRQR